MSTGSALIGRTLAGRFKITGFIGEGAMAAVYRGVQEQEPREVAIKVMHPQLLSDRTFVGRFRREAKAASQIKHPNSVHVLDCGVDGKLLYIAMELLAGQDLFEVLVVERRLSEVRAVNIIREVCDALTAAHEQGIVHRDLKPENIMLLKDGAPSGAPRVKVLDFGIAKILEKEEQPDSGPASSMSRSALTSIGMVVGTPAYMSPEQCRGEQIDPRSDLYAAGILLYQLVTGRLPFEGETAMDFAVRHVRTPPTPPSEVVPAIHAGLERVILRALSKWPAERQQSAAELKEELTRVLPDLAESPHGLAPASDNDRRRLDTPTPAPAAGRQPTPEPATHRVAPQPPKAPPRPGQTLRSEGAGGVKPPGSPKNPAHVVTLTDASDFTRSPTEPATPAMMLGFSNASAPEPPRATTPELAAAPSTPSAPRAPAPAPSAAPSPARPAALGAPVAPVRVSQVAHKVRKPDPGQKTWVLVAAALTLGMVAGSLLFFLLR